jgi:hypothetical protein
MNDLHVLGRNSIIKNFIESFYEVSFLTSKKDPMFSKMIADPLLSITNTNTNAIQ